ncbi:Rv3654c family TadE-like protein [Arthrobacter sp. H14-L1]|uniref:Rv3654c family TadE-like protein n=1 Tax=Arthrobacter sp. H14-L1 TaxID=2996697 RepID=UPI002D1E3A74|nr:Rv3654c family TadE-like protein [Arthrobacter sp. H14-L1]
MTAAGVGTMSSAMTRLRARSTTPAQARRPGATDCGSGTVLTVGLALVLLMLLAALLLLAQAAIGASRAATAADLGALAGADAARHIIIGEPCGVAEDIVVQHHAVMVSCIVGGPDGEIVEVRTRVILAGPWGAATGHSRAGPPPNTATAPWRHAGAR